MNAKCGTAWVVMGVSGCGKSEVGALLAAALHAPFIEGDRFHPDANIAKMSAGVPLSDADREGWLLRLRGELARACEQGPAVLACSALKRSYREVLRGAGCPVRFVHLTGDASLIAQRMGARTGHYMPASLLDSQLRDLEPLLPDEAGITLDIREAPPRLVERVLGYARANMAA